MDCFEKLLTKFDGDKERTVNFITGAARRGEFYELFNQALIEGESRDDILCVSDKKDLIYVVNGRLVRDIGALFLSKKIYTTALDAVLLSTNIVINSCLRAKTVDSLYTDYNLGKIQGNMCDKTRMAHAISKCLLRNMYHPAHPKFSTFNLDNVPLISAQLD